MCVCVCVCVYRYVHIRKKLSKLIKVINVDAFCIDKNTKEKLCEARLPDLPLYLNIKMLCYS